MPIIPFSLLLSLSLHTMRGVTLISTVEVLQEAIYRVNKRFNLHLPGKSVIILVVVYKACIASGGISQLQVCLRLDKTHNQVSRAGTVAILSRLIQKGLVVKKKEGVCLIYSVTLQGSNYIQYFERTLREVRQKF